MSRRIEVELTSVKEDGTWTWRAAGAKQPKGVVRKSLLYEGVAIGDVCRAEADFLLDGIDILQVFPPKAKEERVGLLEMKPRQLRDDELVSTTLAAKGGRQGRGDRKPRGDGKGRDGGRGRDGDSRGERRGPRKPEPEARPRPKRLRPKKEHRNSVLAEVPEELRPIAEEVLKGGMPAVRAAIEKQNSEAKEAGTPEIAVAPVLAIAEDLLPKMRNAEWRDRADAALAELEDLDLRDLRSVVVASDSARDDEDKAVADKLRAGLNERIESDHQQWLADIKEAADSGRAVRALRLSSRPVKAGAPLPPELATRLTAMATDGLGADVAQDRWATVVEAVAFSPIRNAVVPSGYPAEPTKELLSAVRRVADRLPTIAAHFGIDPSEVTKTKRRRPAKKKAAKLPAAPKTDDKAAKRSSKPAKADQPAKADKVPETSAETETKPDPKAAQPEDRQAEDRQPEPTTEGKEVEAPKTESEAEAAPAEPETAEAKTAEPETAEPETAEPETAEPETAEPETAEPEAAEPETAEAKTAES